MIDSLYNKYLNSKGVFTDSRKIIQDGIFVALKGPNFNGNEYAADAILNGAKYAVVDEKKYFLDERTILVQDCLDALQQLATYHRSQLNNPVLGITGSNGKTTTKELITAVLSNKYKAYSTPGNFNNQIGLPLTLLQSSLDTEILILEMGANHIGEIAALCDIGNPTHGLITNIGKAHLEGFGDFQGVITAKSELYKHIIENDGTLFVHSDDEILMHLSEKAKIKYHYGGSNENGIYGSIVEHIPTLVIECSDDTNTTTINTQLTGTYNLSNILAAIAIGRYFEVPMRDIQEAISNYAPTNNRSQLIEHFGAKVILDAYNANPSSITEAIQNLSGMQGKKMAILGDMMELGEHCQNEHRQIIDLVLKANLDKIILVGSYFKEVLLSTDRIDSFETTEELKEYLSNANINMDWILIKGSRKMKLEELID